MVGGFESSSGTGNIYTERGQISMKRWLVILTVLTTLVSASALGLAAPSDKASFAGESSSIRSGGVQTQTIGPIRPTGIF